jgi:hypothetical protein
MKNRGHGFWDTNQQKLSNNSRATGTHSGLMSLMISQFNSWTSIKRENVLIIKTSELFEASIVNKLKTFLKKDIKYFPLPYTPSKTNIENIKDANLVQVFKKYETEITRINNFTPPA